MNLINSPTFRSVRGKGLIRFSIGLLAFVPILILILFLSRYVSTVIVPIVLLLPGAYALSGLVQVITGVPFIDLALRWDKLQGWQRGVFGTFIVLVAIVVIVTVVGFIAFLTNRN